MPQTQTSWLHTANTRRLGSSCCTFLNYGKAKLEGTKYWKKGCVDPGSTPGLIISKLGDFG